MGTKEDLQGLVNVPMFHITQLLGISFPTDIRFGDVKEIPKRDINPNPCSWTSIPQRTYPYDVSINPVSMESQGITSIDTHF